MSTWTSYKITNAGKQIMALVTAGSTQLHFTKMVLGDGTANSTDEYADLTDLKHPIYTGLFSLITTHGNALQLEMNMSNASLDEPITVREIGLYATNPNDADGKDVLFSVALDKEPETIQPGSSSAQVTRSYQAVITVSDTSTVTAEISNTSFVSRQTLNFIERNRSYNIGDIALLETLPSWARLECVQAGTTSESAITLPNNVKAGLLIDDGSVKWIIDDIRDGHRAGDIALYPVLRDGYIKANGAEVLRADYPRLMKFVEDNKLWFDSAVTFTGTTTVSSNVITAISADDISKLNRNMLITGTGIPDNTIIDKIDRTALTVTVSNAITATGTIQMNYGYAQNFPAFYGIGDGKTTFTLPNGIGRILQGATAYGSREAGLPEISGLFQWVLSTAYHTRTGAFGHTFMSSTRCGGGSLANFTDVDFYASRCSSIYGNSDTVQQASIDLIPQIKY